MATIVYTTKIIESVHGHSLRVSWLAMAAGDTGDPFQITGHPDRSVQLSGTTVTSVAIQGCNQDTAVDWATLHDVFNAALTGIAAKGISQIAEITQWIRPNVTAGTAVDVTMIVNAAF